MHVVTAVILGLVGSLHCLGMCGPLAVALPPTGRSRWDYFAGRVMYNLGRVITYSVMGLVFGLIGKSLLLAGVQRWLSIGVGVAILFAVVLGPRYTARLSALSPVHRGVARLKSALSSLLGRRSLPSMLLIGLLNGLLPCGLVYAALAGAVTTGSPVRGTEYMVFFGLGTFPMMLAVSFSGKWIQSAFRLNFQRVIPLALVTLAALFILRGLSLGIPYLSPDLSTGVGVCH